jgi:hypothetical protein
VRSSSPLSRRAFLASLSAAPLLAGKPWEKGKFWEKHPFPEWTDEEADQLLTKSPWTHEYSLQFDLADPGNRRPVFDYSSFGQLGGGGFPQGGGIPGVGIPGTGGGRPQGSPTGYPGGGGGQSGGRNPSVRSEAYLTIRWSSALPIRQAMAIEEHGRKLPREVQEELAIERDEYVVEVFGLPAIVVHKDVNEMEDELTDHALLDTSSGPRISVDSVKMPPHGAYLSMTFRFPRREVLSLEHKEVVFYAAAGPFVIEEKFKLKNMVYGGQLAL